MEQQQTNTRVRMKLSETAKGLIQWEVTSEFDSVEQSAEELSKAIKAVKQVIKDNGLTEVGTE